MELVLSPERPARTDLAIFSCCLSRGVSVGVNGDGGGNGDHEGVESWVEQQSAMLNGAFATPLLSRLLCGLMHAQSRRQ